MKPITRLIRRRMIFASAMLWLCCSGCAWTQDSSAQPPLGDVARKSRQERSEKDHVVAKKVMDAEWSPKATPHAFACKVQFCSSLTITLPAPVAWNNAGYIPVPLPGHEDDKSRSIRIYEGDSLPASDAGWVKRLFLHNRLSYFFGQPPRFLFDERTRINGWPARITHFTVASRVMKFRGLGLVAAAPDGGFGFACVFREEDSGDATNICESILNSARIEVAEKYRTYVPPDDPPTDDPPDNPPEDNL